MEIVRRKAQPLPRDGKLVPVVRKNIMLAGYTLADLLAEVSRLEIPEDAIFSEEYGEASLVWSEEEN